MKFGNPKGVHNPLASYSHYAKVGREANWLLLSGQIGMDINGTIPEDAINQMEVALDNILIILKEAGMTKENLVKLVFYFVGPHDADKRRSILNTRFGEHHPCTTVIFVAGLATTALKVEIDAWACGE